MWLWLVKKKARKSILRVVASVVAIVFFATELSRTAPLLAAPAVADTKASIEEVLQDPSQINVPFEHVTLKEIHQGSSDKLIIHIQDAHTNFSGQKSLAGALDFFMSTYGIPLVLVEGGAQDATLDELRGTAPLETWQRIARQFLYDGLISGEEYLNLTTEHPMKIVGIEDQALYDDSLTAYARLKDRRSHILLYLEKIRVSMERIKRKLYPEELLSYEKAKDKSEKEGDEFKATFDRLVTLAAKAGIDFSGEAYPEVLQLKAIQEKEKTINFDQANLEQSTLFSEFSSKGLSKKMQGFVEASKRMKNMQVSQYMLLNNIFNLADANGISIKSYKALLRYHDYLKDFSELKIDSLLDELEALEDRVYAALLGTDDAKKLRAVDRFVGLVYKAYEIKMSSKDFDLLMANEPDFPTEAWQAFLNEKLAELGYYENVIPYRTLIDEARPSLGNFYELVDQRDIAFIRNTKSVMESENQKVAFLISGGYHTEHLTNLLREEGFSYIVLTPLVTFETDYAKYEDILLAGLQEKVAAVEGTAAALDTTPGRATWTSPRGIRPGPLTTEAENRLPLIREPLRKEVSPLFALAGLPASPTAAAPVPTGARLAVADAASRVDVILKNLPTVIRPRQDLARLGQPIIRDISLDGIKREKIDTTQSPIEAAKQVQEIAVGLNRLIATPTGPVDGSAGVVASIRQLGSLAEDLRSTGARLAGMNILAGRDEMKKAQEITREERPDNYPPGVIPHLDSHQALVQGFLDRGLLDPTYEAVARTFVESHDLGYSLDFTDVNLKDPLIEVWTGVGKAIGLDSEAAKEKALKAYAFIQKNANFPLLVQEFSEKFRREDPLLSPAEIEAKAKGAAGAQSYMVTRVLGHGSMSILPAMSRLEKAGFTHTEALGIALLFSAHHPGFPITLVEQFVVPDVVPMELLPILLITDLTPEGERGNPDDLRRRLADSAAELLGISKAEARYIALLGYTLDRITPARRMIDFNLNTFELADDGTTRGGIVWTGGGDTKEISLNCYQYQESTRTHGTRGLQTDDPECTTGGGRCSSGNRVPKTGFR